eukprot:10402143-Alexandrium_andersonii.AAC.1
MRAWQDPDAPLLDRLKRFATIAELDVLCVHRLRRIPEQALAEVLNKQRWGRRTGNMNAVVTAESKRAVLRVRSEPDADLEAFFRHHDPDGRLVDEDCRNFIRAEPTMIRAAVVFVGW